MAVREEAEGGVVAVVGGIRGGDGVVEMGVGGHRRVVLVVGRGMIGMLRLRAGEEEEVVGDWIAGEVGAETIKAGTSNGRSVKRPRGECACRLSQSSSNSNDLRRGRSSSSSQHILGQRKEAKTKQKCNTIRIPF